MSKPIIQTRLLAEVSIFAALSAALYTLTFPFLTLPFGGSITAGSMIPIIWLAFRRGVGVGILGGMVFGLVALPIDVLRLPFLPIVHPVQVLLDYPIAFGFIGLAGLFKTSPSEGVLRPLAGVAIATLGRFLSHFIAGIFFWTTFGLDGIIYSAVYNGSFLTGEFVIAMAIMYIIVKKDVLEIYM